MDIDEGAFLVMSAAAGAFSCRVPPFPKYWNPIDRPHVALIVLNYNEIFRIFLSRPEQDIDEEKILLEVSSVESLPPKSIVEVKHDSVDFSYYRKEESIWTKVGEAQHPFLIEVYSHSADPIIMTSSPQT